MRASLFVCAATLTIPGVVRAEAPAYDGIGRAPLSGGDRVKARDRALDEAFQHVVEAAAAALLGPDVLKRRASDLRLKVLPKARGYVTSYRVLDQGETEPGFFTVHVGADVDSARLVRELGGGAPSPAKAGPPAAAARFGLCVRSGGQVAPLPQLEQTLRSRLEAAGLVIATSMCDEKPGTEGLRGAVYAEVDGGPVGPVRGTALVGREAKLALRLLEADGRRSAEGQGRGAGYGAAPQAALDDAAVAALPEATPALDAALAQVTTTGEGQLVVQVLGVRKLAQLATARAALERIPGVDAVELRRFASAGGPVELRVRTTQTSQALLQALERGAATSRLRPRASNGNVVIDVPDASDPLPPAGTP